MEEKILRKEPIRLPSRILLNREGSSMLGRLAGLSGVRAEVVEDQKTSLVLDECRPLFVQRLIMNAWTESVQVRQGQLLGLRPELVGLNKVIVYALLYKRLSPSVASMLLDSPVVRDFNRRNPRHSIVSLEHIRFEPKDARSLRLLHELKGQVMVSVRNAICEREDLPLTEKPGYIRGLKKFIELIDSRIWAIYFVLSHSGYAHRANASMTEIILGQLSRTVLADYLSAILLEFIQNAEYVHFLGIMKKIGHEVDPVYLENPQFREHLTAEAERLGIYLDVLWAFPGGHRFQDKSRFEIQLTNCGAISESLRSALSCKMNANSEGLSMADLYDYEEKKGLGAGLGLYYNSYLQAWCKEKHIHYHCALFPNIKQEKTTVRISLHL